MPNTHDFQRNLRRYTYNLSKKNDNVCIDARPDGYRDRINALLACKSK